MSAVNPILVVTNNLPDYARELHDERIKLQDRLAVIDAQFVVLGKLAIVVGIDIGTTVERRAEIDETMAVQSDNELGVDTKPIPAQITTPIKGWTKI